MGMDYENERKVTTESEAEQIVRHWKEEVQRLQTLLKAEQHENDRLHCAVAHLKEATGAGWAIIVAAEREAEDENYIPHEALKRVADDIAESVERANNLILPLADEYK